MEGNDRNRGEAPRHCEQGFDGECDNGSDGTLRPEVPTSRKKYPIRTSRHEETTTNEEAIKVVQDAQSNLTQASQILTDFYAKAGQAVYLAHQSLLSEAWTIEGLTTKIKWEVLISLAPHKRFRW